MKNLCFIYNEHSGRGVIKSKVPEIISSFKEAGYDVLSHSTELAGDCEQQVQKLAKDMDLIVVAGGDGTLNEGANGLIKSGADTPIALLPAGSTNDYCKSIGIPRNITEAVDLAINGKPRTVDVGKFNDSYFTYTAAFGAFTDIAYTTNQKLKNVLGYGAYAIEAGKRAVWLPIEDMVCEIGDEILEDGWFIGMITNSRQIGGVKGITGPNVDLNDGILELTLVKASRNPVEVMEMLTSIGSGCDCDFIYRRKISEVTFKSDKPVKWTLDGEYGGEHTNVRIECIKSGLKIIAPEPKKSSYTVNKIITNRIKKKRGLTDE